MSRPLTGIAILWILLHATLLPAQQADTLSGLSAENAVADWLSFKARVLRNHPLSKNANLYRDQAAAMLLRARGGFDPKVYGDYTAKNFNDKNYFQYTEAGIKWPTWLGLELKSTLNYATGDYLNPEFSVPSRGLTTFGFNWTLGQGLLTDERRTALRQARIGIDQGQAERDALLNDLLLEAAKAYWNWVVAGNQLEVYDAALQQATNRHLAIRESYLQGDKPAIDTMETFIQVQNRLLDVNFARNDYRNAALAVSGFLWDDDGAPARPEDLPSAPEPGTQELLPAINPDRQSILQQARISHPELRLYDAKLRTLEAERRLKVEKRKPVLDLNYNILGAGLNFFPAGSPDGPGVLASDIKWGVNVSYPLLNRKARGDLQVTDIKLAQTEFELRQKRQNIDIKVQQYANEVDNLGAQLTLYQNITENYRALLDAENEKFNFGESSVFLINTREQRWLDARVKYLKLLGEYRKMEAALRWAAGVNDE
jgi:outer membrane protein TolC